MTDSSESTIDTSSDRLTTLPLPDGWQYESTVTELEQIIERIESGELELAEVFEQFAIAIHHLQQCDTFLNHHQQQVDLMIETLTNTE
jgi:exodeoxyribonuclease VII small subunit